jgi:hypothetical protein
MTYYPLIEWKIRSNSPHQFFYHKKELFSSLF